MAYIVILCTGMLVFFSSTTDTRHRRADNSLQ